MGVGFLTSLSAPTSASTQSTPHSVPQRRLLRLVRPFVTANSHPALPDLVQSRLIKVDQAFAFPVPRSPASMICHLPPAICHRPPRVFGFGLRPSALGFRPSHRQLLRPRCAFVAPWTSKTPRIFNGCCPESFRGCTLGPLYTPPFCPASFRLIRLIRLFSAVCLELFRGRGQSPKH